jgi:tetratricopeptide (TPR) repeat protein
VVKLPGAARAGERVRRNVGLIDVVPTVLDLLQIPGSADRPGASLLATGAAAPGADRPIYSETMYPLIHFGWSDLASIVSGDLHLVEGLRPELFDLARDPGERNDRTSDERRPLAAMRRALAAVDRTLLPPAPADAETIAALGALGYLGTPSPDRAGPPLADPRDQVRQIAPVLRGLRLYNEGDFAQAIAVLAPAARQGDGSALAWQYLGAAYDALGRQDEALAAYRHGMRLAGSPSYLAETAALRLLELGRAQAAIDLLAGELERFAQGASGARLRVLQSRALLQVGRIADAARAADEAVARDAQLADAYYQRAVVALARKDGLAAIDDLVTATALDARHLEARKALAMLRHAQGDDAEARRLLGEVLAVDPEDRDARTDLATLGGAGARPEPPR